MVICGAFWSTTIHTEEGLLQINGNYNDQMIQMADSKPQYQKTSICIEAKTKQFTGKNSFI